MPTNSPELPPMRCTGPEPAMSTYPNLYRKPWLPHAQPAGMQYTIVLRKENIQYALKLHLQERIS